MSDYFFPSFAENLSEYTVSVMSPYDGWAQPDPSFDNFATLPDILSEIKLCEALVEQNNEPFVNITD